MFPINPMNLASAKLVILIYNFVSTRELFIDRYNYELKNLIGILIIAIAINYLHSLNH